MGSSPLVRSLGGGRREGAYDRISSLVRIVRSPWGGAPSSGGRAAMVTRSIRGRRRCQGLYPARGRHAFAGGAGAQRGCGVSEGAPVSTGWRGDGRGALRQRPVPAGAGGEPLSPGPGGGAGAARPPCCMTTPLGPAERSGRSPDRGGRGQGQGPLYRGRAERRPPCAACHRSIHLCWCP